MRENFRSFISPTELQKEILCYSDAMGFDSNPGFYIERESFQNFLIMYLVYGRLWCVQNGKKTVVEEGEVVFLDLHYPHKYYFEKGISTKIAWIAINGISAVQLVQKIHQNTLLPFVFKTEKLYSDMLAVFEASDCQEPDIFRQSEQCYSLLMSVLKESYDQITGSKKYMPGKL